MFRSLVLHAPVLVQIFRKRYDYQISVEAEAMIERPSGLRSLLETRARLAARRRNRNNSGFLSLFRRALKTRSSDLVGNTTLVCGLVKGTPGILRDNRNRRCVMQHRGPPDPDP